MEITNFKDLVEVAKNQTEPQRLLFLFAKATAMKNAVQTLHHSGTIDPVMCVDKLPEEITSFAALVEEADSISTKWDFVFISSMSGANGKAPTSRDADTHLSTMSNNLAYGRNIASYVVLDRMERPIILA